MQATGEPQRAVEGTAPAGWTQHWRTWRHIDSWPMGGTPEQGVEGDGKP
jgi:hypothetical protein